MKIIFLDRDGVINKFPGRGDYVTKVKSFRFLPGALKALKELTQNGFTIFVISNQAGVSRGVYSQDKLNCINRYMLKKVNKSGAKIKKVFYCTHTREHNCNCRKPKIGSIIEALRLVNKKLSAAKDTFFIGDADMDIEAGKRAGCTTIAVLSGRSKRREINSWRIKPDCITKNLLEAVRIINHENSCCSHLCRGRSH